MLWAALWSGVASAEPSEDLGPFLQWHCATHGRYAGPVPLATVPVGVPVVGDLVDGPVAEIGPDGLAPVRERPVSVAVAADADAQVVADALASLGHGFDPPEVVQLLFAVPEAPVPESAREAYSALVADLRSPDVVAGQLSLLEALGDCDPRAWHEAHRRLGCPWAARAFAELAAEDACRDAVPGLLAWWASSHDGLEPGVPVVAARVWTHGADVLDGGGAWTERAAGYVGADQPAMVRTDGVEAHFRVADPDLWSRRPGIRYPRAAKRTTYGDVRCRATVWIDAEGAADRVQVDGCPNVFRRAVAKAVLKWRWAPPRVAGARARVVTTISFRFPPRSVAGPDRHGPRS